LRYDAFISYSHAGDAALAASVQSSLQRFARPWYKAYALRVFRDQTGLSASPALWNAIVSALEESEYLLLLASPQAAASKWVNQEVEWFLRNRTPDRVLIVITGGQVAWDAATGDFDWSRSDALPKVLQDAFRQEPLYVDLSWAHRDQFLHDARFRDAILDLAAPLHGRSKDDLDSEDLRQHRRTLRIAWSAVALLSLLAVGLGLAAIYATRQSNVARQQTTIAKEQTTRAVEQARIADQQRRLAEDRRMTALSRQLAAQAVGESAIDLDRALLEAVEAFRAAPTFEARQALLAVLFYSPHLRQFVSGPRRVWRTAAMSRDGRTVVALDEDSGNVVIETAAERSLETIGEVNLRGEAKSVAVSADGSLFATGEPGRVVIRSVMTRAVRSSLMDGLDAGGAPAVLSFSPDRTRIAAYESSSGILIWDVVNRRLCVPALRPKRWENVLAFSPDGSVLASGAHDGSIVLWAADGHPIGPPLVGHRAQIFGLAFSPDGKILASGGEDRTVILWDVKTGKPLGPPLAGHEKWPLGNDAWGLSLAFSPDGSLLASAAKDKNVMLWDVASRSPAGGPLKGHAAPPMAVAFSADGRSLLTLGRDNIALRWAADPLSMLGRRLEADGDGVSGLAFSPDGRILATAYRERGLMLWDAERGWKTRGPLRGQGNPILSLQFTSDGGQLLAAAKDRVTEWGINGKKAAAETLPGTGDAVSQVAFSPDGRSTAWSDGSLLLVRTGMAAAPARLPIALASPDHMVMSLAFSPDGRRLASGGFDGTLALWDVGTRQLLWPAARAHRIAVQALAFSPDGRILASAAVGTADFDGSVRLWDTQSGRELPPALTGHSDPVRALVFSPDGKMLACAAGERIVFWDVERRQRLGEAVAGAGGFVTSLAFSPDGQWLGSGDYDDGAIVWDLRPGVWLRQACAIANRNLDEREWTRLIGDNPPYRQSCP
jgi:WD40 repeat protein